MTVRWMCCGRVQSKMASAELNSRLSIECITNVVRRSRLGWFGQVERMDSDDWVPACRIFEVNGVRDGGRARKT